MTTPDEKLDSLLKSVAEIQKAHVESRQDLESRFARLEEDVKSSQLEATEKAVKKVKRERPLEFKKKGHEEQYYFNQDISDCIIAATQQLGRINPSSDRDKALVEKTIKELEEGAASIAQRQKFIRIADQSEHHWQTVAAYKSSDLAADEEDAKRLEKAERTAEQQAAKKRRKAVVGRVTTKQSPDSRQASMQLPQKPLFPRPQLTRSHFTPRMPGPCFNCFEMGHLKANCPKLARTYPFVPSVYVCVVNNICDLSRKGDLSTGSSIWFPIHSDHLEQRLVFPQSSMGDLRSVRSPKSSDLLQHNEPVIPQCSEEVSSQATNCPINLPHLEQCDSISSIKCVPSGSPQDGDRDIPGDIHDLDQIGNDPSLGRFWEAELGGNQVIDVQGRLKASLQFWEQELEPAPWIIDCIKTGYQLLL